MDSKTSVKQHAVALLLTSDQSPFLKIGQMQVVFQISGKMDILRIKFQIMHFVIAAGSQYFLDGYSKL